MKTARQPRTIILSRPELKDCHGRDVFCVMASEDIVAITSQGKIPYRHPVYLAEWTGEGYRIFDECLGDCMELRASDILPVNYSVVLERHSQTDPEPLID